MIAASLRDDTSKTSEATRKNPEGRTSQIHDRSCGTRSPQSTRLASQTVVSEVGNGTSESSAASKFGHSSSVTAIRERVEKQNFKIKLPFARTQSPTRNPASFVFYRGVYVPNHCLFQQSDLHFFFFFHIALMLCFTMFSIYVEKQYI